MKITKIDSKFVKSIEIVSILNNVPIFDKFNNKEINILSRYLDYSELKEGEILFNEGDKGDYLCFIVDGALEVLKTSGTMNDIVISTITRGRSIGEMSIIDDYPRSATVRAKTKTRLVILPKKRFEHILDEYPSVAIKIMKGIARLLSLNLRKVSSRLADYMMPVS